MVSKNIILTGFMGSGKTTVGKEIARVLNLTFLDTDKMIEKEQNRSISDIFKKEGEDYFRLLEKMVVTNICRKDNMVIATGGGTLLNKDNLNLISQTGIIFCLTANIDILIRRMADRKSRPIIAKQDKNAIIELYQSRVSGYNELPNQIDTTKISPIETAAIIIKLFDELNNKPGATK